MSQNINSSGVGSVNKVSAVPNDIANNWHAQTLTSQFLITSGLNKSPKGTGPTVPTPMHQTYDIKSDQSLNAEEQLQRLTVSKGRNNKNLKFYENHKFDVSDKDISPTNYRLDSQNSTNKQKETRNKHIDYQASPKNFKIGSNKKIASPQPKNKINSSDHSPY